MGERLRPGLLMGRDLVRPGAWIPLIRGGTRLTPIIIERVMLLGLEAEALDCVDWSARVRLDVSEDDTFVPVRPLGDSRRHPAAHADSCDLPSFLQAQEVEILHDALRGGCLPSVVRGVVERMDRRLEFAPPSTEFRVRSTFLLSHPLNVMTLSMAVGKSLGFKGDALFELATGALLHEADADSLELNDGLARLAAVGKVRELLRRHADWKQGTGLVEVGGDRPLPHPADVLAVADTYDTMLADRPSARRMPPGVAHRAIAAMAGRRFEDRTALAFARRVQPYPVGTSVRLTDRREARVVDVSAADPLRPVVVVAGERIDLTRAGGLAIADVCVRRKEERTSLSLPVKLRLDDRDAIWAMLVDVSDHGACIEVDGSPETACRAEIELSAPRRAALRAPALVCWMRPAGDSTTRIGLHAPAGGLRREALAYDSAAC
ncbi:MAG: PilZ domain-containing protein [Candidatus Sericytochromatia bacterium]|nr:PilZ domain-containing protein [Candidatus Tanganyikabacteria bacterium]